jgi:SAM-dependent methyltransferase
VSRFGPDPRAFFEAVYQEAAPWDIGGAQPALVALLDEHPPTGTVLDVGCGSGDHAIALARRGLEVLGVDFVEAAIAQARAKAEALPPETARLLAFQVADALRPSLLQRPFGAVVDSGFFHLFEPEPRERFTAELAATLPPGGRYYLLAFAVDFPVPNMPRAVTEEEVRARFTAERGWRILALREAQFLSRVAPVPAVAACLERLPADHGSRSVAANP